MAVRDVLINGDPRLRQPSQAVPPGQFDTPMDCQALGAPRLMGQGSRI
jgi:hypothetical protein